MTIKVTLQQSEYKYYGTYNGYKYSSLQVKRFGNGRIYFTIIDNGMRMATMAKQMKCEDGKVFVSFGKQGKLILGDYC